MLTVGAVDKVVSVCFNDVPNSRMLFAAFPADFEPSLLIALVTCTMLSLCLEIPAKEANCLDILPSAAAELTSLAVSRFPSFCIF